MIWDALVDAAVWLGEALLGLITSDFPAWFTTPPPFVYELTEMVGSMSVWVPFGHLMLLAVLVLGVWLSMFVFKIVKQLLAHVPQLGGAG